MSDGCQAHDSRISHRGLMSFSTLSVRAVSLLARVLAVKSALVRCAPSSNLVQLPLWRPFELGRAQLVCLVTWTSGPVREVEPFPSSTDLSDTVTNELQCREVCRTCVASRLVPRQIPGLLLRGIDSKVRRKRYGAWYGRGFVARDMWYDEQENKKVGRRSCKWW